MEITIKINGQAVAVAVDVSIEVYTYLDQADHKAENLAHEQRRHWIVNTYLDNFFKGIFSKLLRCHITQ